MSNQSTFTGSIFGVCSYFEVLGYSVIALAEYEYCGIIVT
jgi:hypothetical protein